MGASLFPQLSNELSISYCPRCTMETLGLVGSSGSALGAGFLALLPLVEGFRFSFLSFFISGIFVVSFFRRCGRTGLPLYVMFFRIVKSNLPVLGSLSLILPASSRLSSAVCVTRALNRGSWDTRKRKGKGNGKGKGKGKERGHVRLCRCSNIARKCLRKR
jgi:Zn-dependent protease with chaperone function